MNQQDQKFLSAVQCTWMLNDAASLPSARQAAEGRNSRETSFATSVFLIHRLSTSWYKLLAGHNKSLESKLSKCCPSATDLSMITRTKAAQHCSVQETSFSIWRFCHFNSNFLFGLLSNILIFRALSHRVGLSFEFFICFPSLKLSTKVACHVKSRIPLLRNHYISISGQCMLMVSTRLVN